MIKLTPEQLRFILDYFFVHPKYHGWENIGTKLLTNGECIVAGDTCIWQGGIGNFIEVSDADEYFGCVKYTFNLKYFLSSSYFEDVQESYLDDLKKDLNILRDKIQNIVRL